MENNNSKHKLSQANVNKMKRSKRFEAEHSGAIFAIEFDKLLTWFAIAVDDYTVQIYDYDSTNNGCKFKVKLNGHTGRVRCLTILQNGNLASGSDDKTVIIWSTKDWKHLQVLKGHTFWVYSILEVPSKNVLLTGSRDETVKLWDKQNYKDLGTIQNNG